MSYYVLQFYMHMRVTLGGIWKKQLLASLPGIGNF